MLSLDEIERVIPVRIPALAIDRIMNVQLASSVIGEWEICEDAWWTRGHFPDNPVLPGTQIIESMAQTAPFCFYDVTLPRSTEGLLVRVDDAKFVRSVTPPCTLIVKAEVVDVIGRLAKFKCRAFVGGTRVAMAELTVYLQDELLLARGVKP